MLRAKLKFLALLAASALAVLAAPAQAAPTYVYGHISDITFAGSDVLVRVDVGMPDNCVGTPFGWLRIPTDYKSVQAFVLGLWLRGDAAQVSAVFYTQGLVGGYCVISQVDPDG